MGNLEFVIWNDARVLSLSPAHQDHRADDQPRGQENARRDDFFAEKVAEDHGDERIDVRVGGDQRNRRGAQKLRVCDEGDRADDG